MSRALLLSLISLQSVAGLILPDNVGRLPALGWNSWNAYHCDIDESDFLDSANQLISMGFKNAGYEYVNIDDCWSMKTGRNTTTNQIIPNITRFPDGISGTANKIHSMGLKIGIYSSAGTETCAGYPASIGYETIDADTFASWGIDYLKYDNCNAPSNWTDSCQNCEPDYIESDQIGPNGTCLTNVGSYDPPLCAAGYNYSASNTAERYRIMGDALLATNRTILYSLCEWGRADVWTWANATASSWRVTNDINPAFSRILNILNSNSFIMDYVNFWGHNDPDMLEVGNGLSDAQARTHFSTWAAMKSPLIMGTNLATLTSTETAILQNSYLLAFNQDSTYGAAAMPYKWGENPDWTWNVTWPAQYWAGDSSNGTLVLLVNPGNDTTNMTASWSEIPGLDANGQYQVIDVWSGDNLGCMSTGQTASVAGNDTAAYLVQDKCGSYTTKGRHMKQFLEKKAIEFVA